MLQPTLLRMIEPEDVILAEDHPRASLQDDSLLHFPAIDITECSFFGSHGDDAFMVLKDTVFTENMWTTELDVLRNIGFRRANTSETILNVV